MEKWIYREIAKVLILLEKIGIIFLGTVLILILIYGVISGNTENIKPTTELIVVGGGGALLFFGIIIAILLFLSNLNNQAIKKVNEVQFDKFYRDINEKYTPAMSSFLLDNFVENNKDILATILDLKVRKILDIDQDGTIQIYEENIKGNLYLHEKYVIESIKEDNKIDLNRFASLIKRDCINEGLVNSEEEPSKTKSMRVIFFLFIILLYSSINLFYKEYYIFLLIVAIISLIIYAFKIFKNKKNIRTQKGEELAVKFKGFREYLKEYTLVKTRDVEYINILDRYLTYALALGEADTIEKLYTPFNILLKKYIKEITY